MRQFLFATFATMLAAAPVASGLPAGIGPELAPLLDDLKKEETVGVIIQLADRIDAARVMTGNSKLRREKLIRALRSKAETSQVPLRVFLKSRGVTEFIPLWLTNGIALNAGTELIREIAARPEVESVRLDRTIRLVQPLQSPKRRAASDQEGGTRGVTTPEWNISMIRAPELWALGITGQGIVVAGFDTGVDGSHPDLIGRYRGGANSWFDPYGENAAPADRTGHGTQTMGLFVGGDADGTAIGVAPGAQWIAAKIFNDAGVAQFSAIHQAFAWVLDPDGDPATDDAAQVVNNSWGLTDNINECILDFQLDIQTLKAAGIAVVFSAGNSGPGAGTSLSPANYPEGFAVGMVGSGMAVDAQSSRGPSTCDGALYPEVVAPGVLVWTSDLLGGYVEELGTSFAAPHVAGAMALLRQAYPGATVAELEFVLTDSALDLGTTGPDNVAGYGLIDVVQAHSLMATLPCNDVDGDGFGLGATCLVLDCDDADDQVWLEPAEVSSLVFTNGQTLEWNAPVPLGGAAGSVRYDVIRSGDPSDFAVAGSCVESDDGTDRVAVDVQSPSASQTFFYLVRAENDCAFVEGSLGTGIGGAQRTGRACP